MPIYEYKCECDQEIIPFNTSMANYKESYPCEKCGAAMKRHYTPTAVSLNIPGFYSTDNRKR